MICVSSEAALHHSSKSSVSTPTLSSHPNSTNSNPIWIFWWRAVLPDLLTPNQLILWQPYYLYFLRVFNSNLVWLSRVATAACLLIEVQTAKPHAYDFPKAHNLRSHSSWASAYLIQQSIRNIQRCHYPSILSRSPALRTKRRQRLVSLSR